MILDKVLLLKGLGGLTACGGLGCGATYLINPDLFKTNDQILAELISKVGLDCKTPSSTGTECTKVTTPADKKINIKQSNETTGKFEIDTLPADSGKIKLYKLEGDNTGYHKNLKFVIEDGDITKGSSNKLEKFETYEIEEVDESGTKKWYLKRKSTAIDEIKKALGLPDNCTLATTETNDSCTGITAQQLKTINFKDKDSDGASITEGGTVTLTITKTSDSPFNDEGYKFSFQPTEEVTISTTPSNKIKKGTNTEFKIKKEGNSLSLEKAWTVATLAQKVGLTCPAAGSTNECSLPTSETLKLNNDSNDKVTNAKSETDNQKIKYEEDVEGHNQGFKFYVETEVSLANSKKIAGCSTATYEIVKNTTDNKWYLTKKTTTSGGR